MIEHTTPDGRIVKTVGFVMHEDDEELVLARSVHDESAGYCFDRDRKWILQKRVLKRTTVTIQG